MAVRVGGCFRHVCLRENIMLGTCTLGSMTISYQLFSHHKAFGNRHIPAWIALKISRNYPHLNLSPHKTLILLNRPKIPLSQMLRLKGSRRAEPHIDLAASILYISAMFSMIDSRFSVRSATGAIQPSGWSEIYKPGERSLGRRIMFSFAFN